LVRRWGTVGWSCQVGLSLVWLRPLFVILLWAFFFSPCVFLLNGCFVILVYNMSIFGHILNTDYYYTS
jgi:hypothetical protein